MWWRLSIYPFVPAQHIYAIYCDIYVNLYVVYYAIIDTFGNVLYILKENSSLGFALIVTYRSRDGWSPSQGAGMEGARRIKETNIGPIRPCVQRKSYGK
jgi:hypothetical protein